MRMEKRIAAPSYAPRSRRFGPALLLSVVAASAGAGSNSAHDADDSRIAVTAVGGDVDFTMAGNVVSVAPNTTVLLPARIVTGHDGNVALTQAGTRIHVASDTDVEIPAEAVDGNLVARLVQHSGNVFYDVAPRDLGKLRVETPFLVAVIKGTQFNVAVEHDRTTISLFEGSLDIRMPDDTGIIELNAGEIAIRSLIDDSIRIIGMDDLRIAAPSLPAAPVARDDAQAPSRALEGGATTAGEAVATAGEAVAVRADEVAIRGGTKDESAVGVTRQQQDGTATDIPVVNVIALAVDLPIDLENLALGFGRGQANPGLAGIVPGHDSESRGLRLERDTVELPVDRGLDTVLDLDAPSIDVDLDLDVAGDIGGAAAEVGADAGLDLGAPLDVGADVGVELGTVVDTGADVTVGNGQIDLTLDTGGALELDLEADLPGPVDLSLDLGGGRDVPARKPRGLLGALP
jgi:hypothetical protein